jgi:DNA-binding transcriptional regulator YhcF (GntR family)
LTPSAHVPTQAEVEALPTPEVVAALTPLNARAQTVGRCASVLQAYVGHLYGRRSTAALALHEQHGWTPKDIYGRIRVSRRTYTNWQQRAAERSWTIPPMPEDAALAELTGTNDALTRWQPLMEQFVKLRTATFRELLVEGVSDRLIRIALGLTRDQARTERQRALAAGVRPPTRTPVSTEVQRIIADRIRRGRRGYTERLPSENPLSEALTDTLGRPVHRSAVSLAYQKLADAGVVYVVPKVGWFVRKAPGGDAEEDDAEAGELASCM